MLYDFFKVQTVTIIVWTGAHDAFAVKTFVETSESVINTQRAFLAYFILRHKVKGRIGPSYKVNERLISGEEETKEKESTGTASWPLSDSGLSTSCRSGSYGWMTIVSKNDEKKGGPRSAKVWNDNLLK